MYMLIFLPNFSLGVLNPHVLVCGFSLCQMLNQVKKHNLWSKSLYSFSDQNRSKIILSGAAVNFIAHISKGEALTPFPPPPQVGRGAFYWVNRVCLSVAAPAFCVRILGNRSQGHCIVIVMKNATINKRTCSKPFDDNLCNQKLLFCPRCPKWSLSF